MQSRNLQTPGANLLATTDPAREAPQVRAPCNNRGGCPSPHHPYPPPHIRIRIMTACSQTESCQGEVPQGLGPAALPQEFHAALAVPWTTRDSLAASSPILFQTITQPLHLTHVRVPVGATGPLGSHACLDFKLVPAVLPNALDHFPVEPVPVPALRKDTRASFKWRLFGAVAARPSNVRLHDERADLIGRNTPGYVVEDAMKLL